MNQHTFAQGQVEGAFPWEVEQRTLPDVCDTQCPGRGTSAGIDFHAEQLATRQQLVQCLQIVAGIGAEFYQAVDVPDPCQCLGEQRQVGRHQRLPDIALNVLVAEFTLPEGFLLGQFMHHTFPTRRNGWIISISCRICSTT
ncbi:hypothetical protein D3C78_1456390 [compost metagenome]